MCAQHTCMHIHKHTQAYAHIRKHACTHTNTHPQLETPSCLRLLGTHTKGPGGPQEHQGCGWLVIWAPFSETAGSEQSPWEGRAPGVPPPGDEGTALPPKITQSPQSSGDALSKTLLMSCLGEGWGCSAIFWQPLAFENSASVFRFHKRHLQ